MLFIVAGHFKADAEAGRLAIHERYNEHLAQRAVHVRYGGPIFDAEGRRSGVLLIVEAPSLAAAESFLHSSPYQAAGLYERTEISEFRPEIGALS